MSTIVGTNIEITNIKYDSDTTAMIVSSTGGGAGTVPQGLAKYWIDYNKSSNNNVEDSLNSSSITDAATCLLYTSPSPRDVEESRMPSSA